MSPQKRPPGVMLYYDELRPILALLDAEERGELFTAIFDYGESGFDPVLENRVIAIWPFVRKMIDRDIEAYRAKCEKATRAIQARWERERAKNEGKETG